MRKLKAMAGGWMCLFASLFLFPLLSGCRVLGWNSAAYARAWDDFRCDRRTAVFVNLRLDTTASSRTAQTLRCGEQNLSVRPSTSAAAFNAALASLHARNVSGITFLGRTTAHGTIAEFRALSAGFSSVPDPAHPRGRVTLTWNVPRTYRLAPEDAQGKYHPRTFWLRVFGSPWSDTYIDTARTVLAPAVGAQGSSARSSDSPSDFDSLPHILLRSHYGARCHIRQFAYVVPESAKASASKPTPRWTVVREWDEDGVGK